MTTTTFRLSYSNLNSHGITPNNQLKRNSVDMRVTTKVASKILADVTVDYVQTGTDNPALQGGNSPLYAFAYDVARNYNLPYWSTHYIDSVNGGAIKTTRWALSMATYFTPCMRTTTTW